VNGICRRRAPVASKIAFATAADVVTCAGSPGTKRGLIRAVEEDNVNFRDFRKLEDRVRFPINARDTIFVKLDFLLERAT